MVIKSLFSQRKSGADPLENSSKKKRDAPTRISRVGKPSALAANPVLAGIFDRTSRHQTEATTSTAAVSSGLTVTTRHAAEGNNETPSAAVGSHQALARRAVGKGIRHGFGAPQPRTVQPPAPPPAQLPLSTSVADSLSALASNYQNSLNDDSAAVESDDDPTPLSRMQGRDGSLFDAVGGYMGFLSRNSSLVDLAMIAPVDETLLDPTNELEDLARDFGFDDFPNPEIYNGGDGKQDGAAAD